MADYIVQKGDTLGAIAKRNGMTVKQLAELNGIKDVNKIKVGQKLIFQPAEEAANPAQVERTMSDEEASARIEQMSERVQRLQQRTLSQQAKEELDAWIDKKADEISKAYNVAKQDVVEFFEARRDEIEKAWLSGKNAVEATGQKIAQGVVATVQKGKMAHNKNVESVERRGQKTAAKVSNKARSVKSSLKANVPAPEAQPDVSKMTNEEKTAYLADLIQKLETESLSDRAKREINEEINKVKASYNKVVDGAYDTARKAYRGVKKGVKGALNKLKFDV